MRLLKCNMKWVKDDFLKENVRNGLILISLSYDDTSMTFDKDSK